MDTGTIILYGIFIVLPICLWIYFQFKPQTEHSKKYMHIKNKTTLDYVYKIKYIGGNEDKFNHLARLEMAITDEEVGIANAIGDLLVSIKIENLRECRVINIATERGISFSRFVTLGVFSLIGNKDTKIKNLVEINYFDSVYKTIYLEYTNDSNRLIQSINSKKYNVNNEIKVGGAI